MTVYNLVKLFAASSVLSTGVLWNSANVFAEQVDQVGNQGEVCDVVATGDPERPRIAVIGTGIGGSSATHFLRKLLGPSAVIDVYEKSERIGGRMDTITVNGQTMEAGGTIIHSSNHYMSNFTDDMGLEKNVYDSNSKSTSYSDLFGIYNGNKFVFEESTISLFTSLKMIWRYGFFNLWKWRTSLQKTLEQFQKIYKLQDDGKAFETVPEMLRAMGGDRFVDYTKKSIKEVLKEDGVSDLLIDELNTAINRINYGQDSGVNGFTGFVSLAGMQSGQLWNVNGGNYQVCERLLNSSKATVHRNTKVDSIRKETKNNKAIYFLDGKDKRGCDQAYDAVVVAAPLEIPACYLTCSKCTAWPVQKSLGHYQQTVASFIQADLNFKSFGVESAEKMPGNVFTTENKSLSFSTIGTQNNLDGSTTEPLIYKIFSREPLTNEAVSKLFIIKKTSSGEAVKLHAINWLAYPHYTPPEQFSPFLLDEGVSYVNAIERTASAMEMSAIGGRNAALLVSRYLKNSKTNN